MTMAPILAFIALAGSIAGVKADAACTPLAQVAADNGLTSLTATIDAVKAADGADALVDIVNADTDQEEKITLFAPTNEAFAAITDVTDDLDAAALLNVLNYHVVADELTAEDITAAVAEVAPEPFTVESTAGPFTVTVVDGAVLITASGAMENATVTATNITSCAGIVHVIDKVLIPAAEEEECVSLADAAAEAGLTSLVETINAVKEAEGAGPLLEALELDTMAPDAEKITLFAPNNAAFDAAKEVTDALSADAIVGVLQYHIAQMEFDQESLSSALEASEGPITLPTELVDDLSVSLDDGDVMIKATGSDDPVKVVAFDVETCAGIVHVIDGLLVPANDDFDPAPAPAPLNATAPPDDMVDPVDDDDPPAARTTDTATPDVPDSALPAAGLAFTAIAGLGALIL